MTNRSIFTAAGFQEKKVLEGVQPMVLFLTDGHPTVGETDTLRILQNVKKANADTKTAVFSLAFGRKTDFSMLRLLSVQNFGFARKIYTAADASLQLEGFYQEVSSPILSNVTFDYLHSNLVEDSLTETAFHTFYQGGEMVVAGMMDLSQGAEQPTIEYKVTAHQATGDYSLGGVGGAEVPPVLSETVDTYIDMLPMHSATKHLAGNTNFMERLWAYLTIKNLLTRVEKGQLMSCNPRIRDRREEKEENREEDEYEEEEEEMRVPVICNNLERALFLSLRYQFVNPLTSLVVIKPDTIEKVLILINIFCRITLMFCSGGHCGGRFVQPKDPALLKWSLPHLLPDLTSRPPPPPPPPPLPHTLICPISNLLAVQLNLSLNKADESCHQW